MENNATTPDLKLYNSLSRQKETFVPLEADHVRVYACGPTVYSYAHIGNGRMAVVFDLWVRLLKSLYPKVTYASNITDIEDKIIDAAHKAGKPIEEITKKYTDLINKAQYANGRKEVVGLLKKAAKLKSKIEIFQ